MRDASRKRGSGVGKLSDVAEEALPSSTTDEAAAEDHFPMVDEAVNEGCVPAAGRGRDRDGIHNR